MIILLQDRDNNYHLSDYTPYNGYKYTLCNLVYSKADILNTLALDNSFPGICRTCHETYQTMYLDDLEYDPRIAHGRLFNNLTAKYHGTVADKYYTEIKYWDVTHKNWVKLNKYQRKLMRK